MPCSGSEHSFGDSAVFLGSVSWIQKLPLFVQSKEFLGRLSKHELEAITTAYLKEQRVRFRRRNVKKYGNIDTE
jgi:hypothetical protein